MYNDNNEFWGYKSITKTRSNDIRQAYIYLTPQMAKRVASKIALKTKIAEIEIRQVEED